MKDRHCYLAYNMCRYYTKNEHVIFTKVKCDQNAFYSYVLNTKLLKILITNGQPNLRLFQIS